MVPDLGQGDPGARPRGQEEANKLAQLFGIYSANRDVPANTVLALRAYDEHVAKLPITQGSASQIKRANQAMEGLEWKGMKTNSFYANQLKHIDRQRYRRIFGDREVTVDIWMMRMFGFRDKVPNKAQYAWVRSQIREMARQMGWEPEEVQAAGWWRSRARRGHPLETAAFDYAHGLSPIAARSP